MERRWEGRSRGVGWERFWSEWESWGGKEREWEGRSRGVGWERFWSEWESWGGKGEGLWREVKGTGE